MYDENKRKAAEELIVGAEAALARQNPDNAFGGALEACQIYCHLKNSCDSEPMRRMLDVQFSKALEIAGRAYQCAKGSGTAARIPADHGRDAEAHLDLESLRLRPEQIDISWRDICGLDYVRAELNEALVESKKYAGKLPGYERPPIGIILHGPPGCGKTMVGKAVAKELAASFFYVTCSDLLSMYYGQSARLVHDLYAAARDSANDSGFSIIFIDEFEELAAERTADSHEATRKIVAQLLAELDSPKSDGQVFTIGATNLPAHIDRAIKRRRLKMIYIGLPNLEARVSMFETKVNAPKYAVHVEKIDSAQLARLTEKKVTDCTTYCYTGVDIDTIIGLASCRAKNSAPENPKLTMEDFEVMLQTYVPFLSEADLRSYKII